ncbi:hypothetical protein HOP50_17g80130 [Chloropicon primus]|uniref:Uncharacterized protein n=1 Tax=Chloropicon primus TaxID=1764295 RepID=A0A5B8MY14_9CHLO|nr:hypothetical protein A3770_17p79910 [Chloropicon primus]UPR04669.1 hypothetical protein HOP50_17g80130 [Chloropicon primus]|eukprot:QDZ25473.1 hypothetical protein A3770_17p79910 [Chloropicon primus]
MPSSSSIDVKEKLHQTHLKKIVVPLDEEHEESCDMLRTNCCNAFFHYLADRIEQVYDVTDKNREATANACGISDGSAKPKKYRKVRTKLKLQIPMTCMRRNGGFSLLYTNETSGCLELKICMTRKTLHKCFASFGCHDGRAVAAVAKQQDTRNSNTSAGVRVGNLASILGLQQPTATAAAVRSDEAGEGAGSQECFDFSFWTKESILQQYVPSKGPSNTLYRVSWQQSSSSSCTPRPSKVWKLSSLLPSAQHPLVDVYSAKKCSIQDVSGKKFVQGAVEVTARFANSIEAISCRGPKRIKVVEMVLDLVLSDAEDWNVIQVKAIKCASITSASRRTTGTPSKCFGDYCGRLSLRENQFSAAGYKPASSPHGRKNVVTVRPFMHNNSVKPGYGTLSLAAKKSGGFVLCEEENDPNDKVYFKIPYKLILNDRSGVYRESDNTVKWMYKSEGEDRFGRSEWETFKSGESTLIEDAFQKGCKFFRLREGASISFVEEKMECLGSHHNTPPPCSRDAVTHDIKRHPPFVTQQYILDRSKASKEKASAVVKNNEGEFSPSKPRSPLRYVDGKPFVRHLGVSVARPPDLEKKKVYDMVTVCRDCYRIYLCKEHMKLQGMLRE